MPGRIDDRFDKSRHGLPVKHIQSPGLDRVASQFFGGALMVIGDKDRRACLSKGRSDRAADGSCSVHHGGFIGEDVLHLDDSFH